MTPVVLVHLSDMHFGRDVDLAQVEACEAMLPGLAPSAIVISGDHSQRARHGEFQMSRHFRDRVERLAPTLVIPGNHDVQWWASPFGLFGSRRLYGKYRHYFGEDLAPRLEIPGAVIAGALTSYGVAFGSLTWNPNDMAVKGHLPRSEVERVSRYFESAPPGAVRILVTHHNVLPGAISRRMGLAHWRRAQRQINASRVDLVLCGHDHQEGSGQIDGTVTVSTAGTLTLRTRGGGPSAFNVVTVDDQAVSIQHMRWDPSQLRFRASDLSRYGRIRPA
ncbi:MAG TPA: metallophosphoesterase [Gemmatimonadales bacterium]|nr:metallophosphoesterase [Gemmatimonadales bacterium]